jgi:hypothetical protein
MVAQVHPEVCATNDDNSDVGSEGGDVFLLKVDEMRLKQLKNAFDLMDRDGSGSIDAHELGVVLRLQGRSRASHS